MEENIKQELKDIKEEPQKQELVDLKSGENNKKSIKISKKAIIICVIVLAVLALLYFCRGFFVAAMVDGKPISRLSVINKLEKDSGKSLLDSMITEKLVENEAKAKNINISDDEVNTEIKKIETQITSQGITLDSVLTSQGMTMDELKKQIILQKEVEKLLADKIIVTDEEIAQYIKDNKITVAKGQEETVNSQVKEQLTNEKLNNEAQTFIDSLKAKAKIIYFVKY